MENENTSTNCPFCDSRELSNRHVCDWVGVSLITDAHPVTFGHLLGVANSHILSFGEMEVSALLELRKKIIETAQILAQLGPKVVLFERGNKFENRSGRPSVDHAHFHLIPTNDISTQLPKNKKRASFVELPKYINESSYYFYWDILDDIAYWGSAEEVPSQFIRKAVYLQNNLLEWDWRNSQQNNDAINEQACVISKLLKGN